MTSPEEVDADSLYQRAVLRVYGPWVSSDVLSGPERRRARARVEHARLMLAMRGVDVPPLAPAAVNFNEMDGFSEQACEPRPNGSRAGDRARVGLRSWRDSDPGGGRLDVQRAHSHGHAVG